MAALQGKKTYIGLGMIAVAKIASLFNVQLQESETEAIVEAAVQLFDYGMTIAGLALAIYGRHDANRQAEAKIAAAAAAPSMPPEPGIPNISERGSI